MAKAKNIRRRGKSWIVYFRAKGRQHFRSFADRDYGGDEKASRDAAELYLAQKRVEIIRRQFRPPAHERFAPFAERWLTTHPSIDPRTRELYEQRIRTYLTPVLGELNLSEINSDDVRRVKDRAAQMGRSAWTQKGILALLSGILTYALEEQLIQHNPVATLPKRDRPKSREGGRSRKRTLTTDELRALLANAGPYKAMFAVAAYTGLRISEVLALTWEDLDFEQGQIHVHKQLSVPNKYDPTLPHRVDLKSDSDEGCDRYVFLADELARLLKVHRGDRIRQRDEFVFVTSNGTPYSRRNIARAFDRILGEAKITWRSREDKPTFHSLRHTFASAIIAGGADQGHVARLLGHTDPAFTYRVYVHEFDRQRRQEESKAALGVAFAGVL